MTLLKEQFTTIKQTNLFVYDLSTKRRKAQQLL